MPITFTARTSSRPRSAIPIRRASTSCPGSARGMSVHAKIDLCRGLFAILVVLAHSLEMTYSIRLEQLLALPRWFREPMGLWLGSGIYWVMGFFVISGYCIQLSVERLSEARRFPLKVYLLARLTRILPLYYAGLAFTLVVEWLVASHRAGGWPNGLNTQVFLSQVLLIQNLTETFGSYAPSWSITNEMFYYLFYGLLAWLAVRRPDRAFWLGLGICVGIAGMMQAQYAVGWKSRYVLSTGLLFGLGINWFLGVAVAVYAKPLLRSPWVCGLARAWAILLASAFLLRVYGRFPLQGIYLVCGVSFALMLIRFLAVQEARSAVASRRWVDSAARGMGLSSYPMYLFHGPVLMLGASSLGYWHVGLDWRVLWAILTSSGVLTGIALGYLAERPIMSWRADLLRRLKSSDRLRAATMSLRMAGN